MLIVLGHFLDINWRNLWFEISTLYQKHKIWRTELKKETVLNFRMSLVMRLQRCYKIFPSLAAVFNNANFSHHIQRIDNSIRTIHS